MKLYIKHMVCQRCIIIVQAALDKLELHYSNVGLGEIQLVEYSTLEQRNAVKVALAGFGLELMDDKNATLIEKIKTLVSEMLHDEDEEPPAKHFSHYFSQKLGCDYTHMSTVFLEAVGITIAHYIVIQKIERVKELLSHDDCSLTDISYQLNYSSVAHLSNQFKKITGITPTAFKHQPE
ncbi:helix-turn-helix domain-containing protein [Parasediminibacterium sp. JCM 36343]|uniref:helix-turn-helix domain-containing protein n=1 Tax=Parasediminibacterium sp. JCM 36343 TaxID=3374279 RepID=UPI00397E5512